MQLFENFTSINVSQRDSIVSPAELERYPCAIVHIVEPVFLIGITHSQSLIGIELLGQMNNKNDFLVAQQFHKNEFKW